MYLAKIWAIKYVYKLRKMLSQMCMCDWCCETEVPEVKLGVGTNIGHNS
jgi:hypothetical protein